MKRLVPVMLAILLSACSVERRVPPPASPPTQTGISSLPAPSPTPRLLPHRFRAAVSPIPAGLADRMTGTTWRPGCPVPLDELRFLSLR
jgi:hypothetical protein